MENLHMPHLARLLLTAALTTLPGLVAGENKPADPSQYVSKSVSVSGAVEQPLKLSVDDLKKFPAEQIVELVRVRQTGEQRKEEKLTGILLRDLIDRAKVKAPQHNDLKKMAIVAGATDGYKVVFSWNEVFNTPVGDGVLVYFAKNGASLTDDEGQIAMVSIKDLRTGPRHVKWLRDIELKKIAE
jgi:hypothetical protein